MGMSSVVGIVKDYGNSLRSARDGKLKPSFVFAQIGIPVALGAIAGVFRFGIPNSGDFVTGVSIVAALMCGVATLLFQTRIDLRQRFDGESDSFLTEGGLRLVDELFAQVMWSILSGFLLVLLLVIGDTLRSAVGDIEIVVRLSYGLTWGMVANFILTVGVVLKRMRSVYYRVAVHKRNFS